MLSQIQLERFRGFSRYSAAFGDATYLVGPNNAGKSTILTALRMVDAQLRTAFARKPTLYVDHHDAGRHAYPLSMDDFPTLSESVRHDFGSDESRVQVSWSGGLKFAAIWPEDSAHLDAHERRDPYFFLHYANGGQPREPKDVRRLYPSLGVVPPLGPVDTSEPILSEKYVRASMGGRLSSRHFRNQLLLLRQSDQLYDFFHFANEWTPDLQLTDLSVSSDGTGIDVFYVEGVRRLEREIAWAGDGMQVWWQILHHVFRNSDLPTIVLDEPEVFLHPDLQRRLVRLLEDTGKQVIVATHSSELLGEVDAKSIALVDRSTRSARRLKNNSGLLGISDQIGSRFNLGLAKALRSRVVLFLEGKDAQLLRITARAADLPAIDKESGVAIVEMDGFSPHVHVEAFEWFCSDYLSSSVRPYVVLDRDYKSQVQLDKVTATFARLQIPVHIWTRKEVESYYLQPVLIARVSGVAQSEIEALLDEVAVDLKAEVHSQIASHRMESEAGPKKDKATILLECATEFEASWKDPDYRLARMPAKSVLAGLNRRLQSSGSKAVSFPALAKAQRLEEIDPELLRVLRDVATLASRS